MPGFIKKMFIELVICSGSIAATTNVSKFITCKYLNNQPCMARHILIDLNPDKYKGLCYYLDRCDVSCITLDNPFGRIRFSNKTEDVNLSAFDMTRN